MQLLEMWENSDEGDGAPWRASICNAPREPLRTNRGRLLGPYPFRVDTELQYHRTLGFKIIFRLIMVAHAYNLNTQEAETGSSLKSA